MCKEEQEQEHQKPVAFSMKTRLNALQRLGKEKLLLKNLLSSQVETRQIYETGGQKDKTGVALGSTSAGIPAPPRGVHLQVRLSNSGGVGETENVAPTARADRGQRPAGKGAKPRGIALLSARQGSV